MKVVAKIYRKINTDDKWKELLEKLRSEEYVVRENEKGIIIDLKEISYNGNGIIAYELSPLLKDATFLIDIREEGGAEDDSGNSMIVCAFSGVAIRPYYIRRKPRKGRDNAHFCVPKEVINIMGYNKRKEVTILHHEVKPLVEERMLILGTKTLFKEGLIQDLPYPLKRFSLAALAAIDKAQCKDCICIHYALSLY